MNLGQITSRTVCEDTLTLYQDPIKKTFYATFAIKGGATIAIQASSIFVANRGFSNYVSFDNGIPYNILKPDDQTKVVGSIERRDIRTRTYCQCVGKKACAHIEVFIQATRDSLKARKSFEGGTLEFFNRVSTVPDERATLYAKWKDKSQDGDEITFREQNIFLDKSDKSIRLDLAEEDDKTRLLAQIEFNRITMEKNKTEIHINCS